MIQETRQCQNCKKDFTIEFEDFEFYEKIKVPAPTFCPECRLQRKLARRNERALYKRKCDLCSKEILSIYSLNCKFPVYCHSCWWSDKWDAQQYNQDINFSETFFSQVNFLENKVPKVALYNVNSINSDYCNICLDLKDCYLLFGSWKSEGCLFGNTIMGSNNVIDSLWVNKCENCSYLIDCEHCYNTHFSQNSQNCMNSYFLFDCRNCEKCIFSKNLRNKSYHVFNKPVTQEEFNKLKTEIIGFFSKINNSRLDYESVKKTAIHRFMIGSKYVNSTGNFIYNSKSVKDSYFTDKAEDLKYAIKAVMGQKDSHNIFGVSGGELMYDSLNVDYSSRGKFILNGLHLIDVFYSIDCHSSSHLFACIGLRNKQYCILNKQYTPESYKETVERIKEHMNTMPYIDSKGRIYKYGEFFPPELSPFSYNETVAQEYFPLTKEQAIEQGYKWKDPEERNIKITLTTDQLPDHIKDVDDSIINQIIECEHQGKCNEQCTEAFKIIKSELDFYRKMNLPLPRLCPNCRHYQRIKQRNPLKLWKRQCMCNQQPTTNNLQPTTNKYQNTIEHFHRNEPCPNEFQTTYSPDRPEIVYCEQCYNAEVV